MWSAGGYSTTTFPRYMRSALFGAEELPSLSGGGASLEVRGDERGRLVTLLAVDPVPVQPIREIRVGIGPGGPRDCKCRDHDDDPENKPCERDLDVLCTPHAEAPVGNAGTGDVAVRSGRLRTRNGHQNQRPRIAAIDGVINERTTKVSNSSPSPIVVPPWPIAIRSLVTMDAMVTAKTRPAAVTTPPVAPVALMIPVLMPAPISSLNRETTSRL